MIANSHHNSVTTLGRAALAYAARGWLVFPLYEIRPDGTCSCPFPGKPGHSPGKHPRTRHGVNDATTCSTTIGAWWTQWPNANVGIATGSRSGIVVLDVDPRHRGDESLAHLEREHGPLPEAIESLTGGGGRHLLFAHPDYPLASRVGIALGLDVRGDGGYIVAPPSVTVGPYAWDASRHPDDLPLAAAPAWLLRLMAGRRDPLSRDGTALFIPMGIRNHTLVRFAGLLRHLGLSAPAIAGCLVAISAHHCCPPLDSEEVAAIAKSVARYPVSGTAGRSGRAPQNIITVEVG